MEGWLGCRKKLYCNTLYCIVTWGAWPTGECLATRRKDACWGACDTALGRGARRAGARRSRHSAQGRTRARCDKTARPAIRPGGPATTRTDPPTTRPRAHGLCAQAELWLCTWCTWPVFDSVLFLSHFLDTVHHKKFSKFFYLNKIKSNKMRQNFRK